MQNKIMRSLLLSDSKKSITSYHFFDEKILLEPFNWRKILRSEMEYSSPNSLLATKHDTINFDYLVLIDQIIRSNNLEKFKWTVNTCFLQVIISPEGYTDSVTMSVDCVSYNGYKCHATDFNLEKWHVKRVGSQSFHGQIQ